MIKFLVIDDSAIARKMIIKTILEGQIFSNENSMFAEASDGVEGLEAFKIKKPQIVLTDWTMPNMDGYTLVQEIRKINPKVPIIMIASEGTPDRIQKATAAGMATDYVVKPLEPGILEQKLLKAFEALRSDKDGKPKEQS